MSLLCPLLIDTPAVVNRRNGFVFVDAAYATGICLRFTSLKSMADASVGI